MSAWIFISMVVGAGGGGGELESGPEAAALEAAVQSVTDAARDDGEHPHDDRSPAGDDTGHAAAERTARVTLPTYQIEELAELMAANGALAESIAMYRQLLIRRPGDPDAFLALLGVCLRHDPCAATSNTLVATAVEIFEGRTDDIEGVAWDLLEVGRLDAAVRFLSSLVERLPNARSLWEMLIGVLVDAQRTDEAIASVDRYLAYAPKSSAMHQLLIELLENTGQTQRRDAAVAAFIQQLPNNATAWALRCSKIVYSDDLEEGRKCLRHAWRLPNPTVSTQRLLAELSAEVVAATRERREEEHRVFKQEAFWVFSMDDLEPRDDY